MLGSSILILLKFMCLLESSGDFIFSPPFLRVSCSRAWRAPPARTSAYTQRKRFRLQSHNGMTRSPLDFEAKRTFCGHRRRQSIPTRTVTSFDVSSSASRRRVFAASGAFIFLFWLFSKLALCKARGPSPNVSGQRIQKRCFCSVKAEDSCCIPSLPLCLMLLPPPPPPYLE